MKRYDLIAHYDEFEMNEDVEGEWVKYDDHIAAMQAKDNRIAELEAATKNAKMYLESGFINCQRCAEEVPTKDTDAEYELRNALAAPKSQVSHDRT